VEKLSEAVDFPVVVPRRAPRGFRLERAIVRGGGESDRVHLIYSDGLVGLSLLQRSIPEGKEGREDSRLERWNRGGITVLSSVRRGVRIVGLGPIPTAEMAEWLASMEIGADP
jgi:negative regulator of sigma E activity